MSAMNEESAVSYLYGSNAAYIEALYEHYLENPNSVEVYWKNYFDLLISTNGSSVRDIPHQPIQESFVKMLKSPYLPRATEQGGDTETIQKQSAVLRLITAYRTIGARHADLDPLRRMDLQVYEELNPAYYGLTDADMALQFDAGSLTLSGRESLSNIIAKLKQIYCGKIGLEYMHITRVTDEKEWIRNRFEGDLSTPRFTVAQKGRILKQLTAAETLERYLHKKYVGQKRFSLEGGESAIAILDYLIQFSTRQGIEEIVIGMAHRGRLNVLVNILGKLPRDLFSEFEGKPTIELSSGDVKYHMGFSSSLATENGAVHVSLAFNPSHLEIVNPVIEGSVRARQDQRDENGVSFVLPVLIHGDAAFSGLGVNQGTFNLSQTRGYGTGGTIHIVINNQIGFTTSDPRDIRSTTYCTDIAKMIEAPIIHVNGDDPEAACYAMQAAMDYRNRFNKDIVIDLVCYRKLGHNEGDDPYLTQPMMYNKIAKHPGVRALYAERLAKEHILTEEDANRLILEYREALDRGEHVEQTTLTSYHHEHAIDWRIYTGIHWAYPVDTALLLSDIQRLADRLTDVPADFHLHNTVVRMLNGRKAMAFGEQPVDWGMAETLAYASLVVSGHAVRLSGEDSGRGTFSHRHAVLHDQKREYWDQGVYIPLQNIAENQASFDVYDSVLNEEAVLAYEYGYSCSAPDQLVIWEAQFGDFANGAQVAIDQFIASGETKWGRLSGLTVILPHGYDGQGPEHSSARIERWLQLCAEHNMQIIVPSEAAQMFHLLRRQVLRPYRKPLIIFMSKRMLRFKDSMSQITALTDGCFRTVIADPVERDDQVVERLILCSGQVYYDLVNKRKEQQLEQQVAIVRLEQLYPFPTEELAVEIQRYKNMKELVWAQEEPKNQGAWNQIRHRLEKQLTGHCRLSYAGRPSSASPAVGYLRKHNAQLQSLLEAAMGLEKK